MQERTYFTERPEEVEYIHTACGTTVVFVYTDIQEEEEGFSAVEHFKTFEGSVDDLTPAQVAEIINPIPVLTVEEKISALEDAIVELAEIIGGE